MAFSRWLWVYALSMIGLIALGLMPAWLNWDRYSVLALATFFLFVLLASVFTYTTVRYITTIVHRIEFFAHSVATGNLHTPLPRTHDHGEIGRILQSLDVMQVQLRDSFNALHSEQSQNALLVQAINQSSNSVMVTDTQAQIIYVNNAFIEQTGYSREEALGKTPQLIQSGKTLPQVYTDMRALLQQGKSWNGELINRRKDGSEFIETVNISPVRDHTGKVHRFLAVKQDITDMRRAQDSVERLAYFDPLTDLPNRRSFLDQLNQKISESKRIKSGLSLIFIDLNRFKEINDTHGHLVGDQVLIEVAKVFSAQFNNSVLARLGGDEFVILVDETQVESAFCIAEKLLHGLGTGIEVNGYSFAMSASIGVAFYPQHGENSTDLLRHADIAMYQAKAEGNGPTLYEAWMSAALEHDVLLATRLQQTLVEQNGLQLVMQPQINIQTGMLSGAEVLLRWHDEVLGQVSPAEFIPLAEERGLIQSIDKYVIAQSCATLMKWRNAGTPLNVPLSVNVSMALFQTNEFSTWLKGCMEGYGVKPHDLELEITETGLMHSRKQALETAASLHKMGVELAIDDFGTGYSSLAYLKQFSPAKVKIDQSFIRDLATSEASQAIVRATVSMASELGMQVLAEGVEGPAEADLLKQSRCDMAQGYLYAKPMLCDEFISYAAARAITCHRMS